MKIASRELIKDITILSASSSIVACCSLVSLTLNARSLGPSDFGGLTLIQTYIFIIAGISTFETWQPIIRLGFKRPRLTGAIISSCIALDILAALAAFVVATIGIKAFSSLLEISDNYKNLSQLYAIVLLAGISGTPKGYFRLEGRFDILAANQIYLAIVMMFSSAVLWGFKCSLKTYIFAFAVLAVFYNFSLFLRMIFMIKKNGIEITNPVSSKRRRKFSILILRAATGSSLLSTLLVSRRHIALLIVGSAMGELGAGLYAVAAKLTAAVSRFTALLNQVIFQAVMKKSVAKEKTAWKKDTYRATLVITVIVVFAALAGVVFSEEIVAYSVGESYLGSAKVFALLFVAECIVLAGILFNPVIQEKYGPKPLVLISAFSMTFYIPVTTIAIKKYGLTGAGVSMVITALLSYTLLAIKTRKTLN